MSWSTADIPDQTGRVALVTGANGGLGLETTRELARRGAHVIMATRDQDKASAAEADLLETVPGASYEILKLDLASLESVRSFADRVSQAFPKLDILVNNAGIMAVSETWTDDGFEMQFGVDHLGHFALTALVLPSLLRADEARVVTVTSTGRHYGKPLDPDNPHLAGRYTPWAAYGQAKMANLQFAYGLNTQFVEAGVAAKSLAVQPGYVNTDLQARSARESGGGLSQRFFHTVVRRLGMSPAAGALCELRAATDPEAKGGTMYGPRFITNGPPVRLPLTGRGIGQKSIDTLWEVSERETGIDLDVSTALANLNG